MSGRIVVFEGLDGVGKTTLSRGLARDLHAVWLTTPAPELRAIRAVVDERWGPDERALFYAGSVLNAGREALAHAAGGQDVVIDRYWLSTWVYARLAGATVHLNAHEPDVVVPDVTVLVVADENLRRRRLGRRKASAGDLDSVARAIELRRLYDTALASPIVGRLLTVDTSADHADALAARMALELDAVRPVSRESAQLSLFDRTASSSGHARRDPRQPMNSHSPRSR